MADRRRRAARNLTTAPNIPLRLRRRRDGTLALTDHRSAVDAPDYAVPAAHLFTHGWLLREAAAARAINGVVTISLVNAKLTYRITELTPDGAMTTFESGEVFDAPAIDEQLAERIVAERQERERAAALDRARQLVEENK